MKSPVCKRLPMKPVELEDGLEAYRCVETGGIGDGLLDELDGLRDRLRKHPERDYALAYLNHLDSDSARSSG